MGTLQLIQVEDFKSWRGRQLIGPFMRFNCIIGPNGSGKSNVMDAISFVMGERTASLRVKHIKDLIHGAHIGHPVSSTARVTMLYETENGEELSFTRAIIGNSSEFRLNHRTVSRVEYTNQLEKIGILLKGRNCLVFQGAVENIAMKKPKERTQLFEQVSNSGELSNEYDKKKKEMMNAEEEARFNYNKKKNVAVERKHAKHEKEEADRYQMLIEELKTSRAQLHLFLLYYNEKLIENFNNELQASNKAINSEKARQAAAEEEVRMKKKELGKLNRELQQIENEIKVHDSNLNEKRPSYIKSKENTRHYVKKVEAARKSLKSSEKQCSIHQQTVKELELELKDVNKVWKGFEEMAQAELSSRGRSMELEESQIQQYKELKELVRKQVSSVAHMLEKLRWEQKTDRDKLELDQRNYKDLEIQIKHTELEIENYMKRIEKLEEYINTCKASLTEQKQCEEELTNEIQSAKLRIVEVSEKLNEVAGELQNAGIDHREGHRQQKKAEILESLKRLYPDSVYGRLVDLCHPIHKKYQLAVTKVFGRYINAIVVATEKTARDCIRYLKEERAEPETFLALDYLDIKSINEQLREIKGAKMMIDVVRCVSPQLKKVVQFVCGNGLVCENLKEARQIAYEGPERLKTVSLDGTLFLKSGVISGGSSDLKFKARCWDEKEISQLKEVKEKLRNELRELTKVNRKEAELRQLQAQAKGTETRMRYSLSDLEQTRKKHLVNRHMERSKLESGQANLQSQMAVVSLRVQDREVKMQEIQNQMNEVEDRVFEDFCTKIGVANIREYEDEHVKQLEEIDTKRSEFENQKTRLMIQLEYSYSQIEEDIKKIQKWKEAIKKDEEEIVKLKKEEMQLMRTVDEAMVIQRDLNNKLLIKKTQVKDAQKELEEVRKKLLNITRDLAKLQKEYVSVETSIEQKRLERHNLLLACKVQNVQIELLQGKLEKISEVLTEEESTQATTDMFELEAAFEIDYSSLPTDLKDLASLKEIEIQENRLNKLLEEKETILHRTAAPNLRAVEKLQNVWDKFQESVYAFESSRKKARICRQDFEYVKRRRYDLFNQCFEHISVKIDQIYKMMCQNTSAQAFLSPENSEEPYLEGIGYNCVAPGKRFMPMDNLSGGEKAVAALALLFAIHSYRPAPFFVLDEVDAALDNTNIGKVTNYIRDQSRKNFQVIVISLKEEFYSKADALIGVYPEQGECMSSQLLTFDLTSYPENTRREETLRPQQED
ncbi:structural maintenance of chromosomes protein 1B-like isoform X1 [Scyliorhinus canicula]|uniref:structural maintenance of chromosomes protein 1B-like isoform X1 n=1 Tax=Scyliorhinus canicula TaxID=7830 RepID=UPI0018F6041E|nr:structural maintenance of chromosomes protein 1B-like isoform X1 [Scyliorhinus canicula]